MNMEVQAMRGRKTTLIVRLEPQQRDELESWQRKTSMPAGLVRRARAILELADCGCICEAARRVGMSRRHMEKWAKRFLAGGVAGLHDKPRPGRKPVFSPRRGGAYGQAGVRVARQGGPVAVAMG